MKKRKQLAEVTLFSGTADLPPGWDALLPEDHFLKSGSLALYEQAALPDVHAIYALVWSGGRPVAAAYFQVLRIGGKHLNPEGLKPWQRPLWKVFTGSARPRLLVAGHLFRHDIRAFYANPSLEPFEAFNLYRAALDRATRQSCAAAVLLKDPPEAMLTYFQQFAPEYLMLRADVSMEMAVQPAWNTFADYEKALKHKYAQRTRNVRRSKAALVIREFSVAEVTERAAGLHTLYRQVTERQPVRLGFLSPELLPMLKQQHPDTLRVWGFFEEETLVAFSSAWVKEEAFDMFYIGFDYERNSALQLYFNILFFAVEQAISLRKEKLILGRTALEAKARLGCKPRYLQTFLYIRNPVLRAWVTRQQGRFSAGEGEWESRHPFKGG